MVKYIRFYFYLKFLVKIGLYIIFIACSSKVVFPQQKFKFDNLEKLNAAYKESKIDSQRVNILGEICFSINKQIPDSVLKISDLMMEIAKKAKYQRGIGLSYYYNACANNAIADYRLAIDNSAKAFSVFKKEQDTIYMIKSLILEGNAREFSSNNQNYGRSLFWKALKIALVKRDSLGLANVYLCLGLAFGNTEMGRDHIAPYEKALEYYWKGVNIAIRNNFEQVLQRGYSLIGNIYKFSYTTNKADLDKALYYYEMARKLAEKNMDPRGVFVSINNMCEIYMILKLPDKVKELTFEQFSLAQKTGSKYTMANAYRAMSELSESKGELNQAIAHLNMGIAIAREININHFIRESLVTLCKLYYRNGEFKKGCESYEELIKFYQLTSTSERDLELFRTLSESESNHKDEINRLENKKREEISRAEARRKNIIIISFVCGLVLVLIFLLIIFNRFKLIKKQKFEIEKQKHLVEEKQKEVMDSIAYAKRIQQALLPSGKYIERVVNKLNKK